MKKAFQKPLLFAWVRLKESVERRGIFGGSYSYIENRACYVSVITFKSDLTFLASNAFITIEIKNNQVRVSSDRSILSATSNKAELARQGL